MVGVVAYRTRLVVSDMALNREIFACDRNLAITKISLAKISTFAQADRRIYVAESVDRPLRVAAGDVPGA